MQGVLPTNGLMGRRTPKEDTNPQGGHEDTIYLYMGGKWMIDIFPTFVGEILPTQGVCVTSGWVGDADQEIMLAPGWVGIGCRNRASTGGFAP